MKQILEDLRKLQSGAVNCQDFGALMGKWPTDVLDNLTALHHYIADEDIRSKDAKYEAMQNKELEKLISLVEANADSDALQKITFLRLT